MSAVSLPYYRDLVFTLVAKELKVRYKSTFLGYFWSILNPLAFACVYYFAFGIVLNVGVKNYALIMISALFPWQWFANSVNSANTFFLANAPLIKKVRFPRIFLVLAGVLNDLVHYLISIPVVLVVMWKYGVNPTLDWLWLLPLLLLVQLLVTTGVCLVIATANLFFRDLERLTVVFVMLWFYVTPVIYPASMLEERHLKWVLFANPMGPVIVGCALFMGRSIAPEYCLAALAWGVGLFAFGYLVYHWKQERFAEIV